MKITIESNPDEFLALFCNGRIFDDISNTNSKTACSNSNNPRSSTLPSEARSNIEWDLSMSSFAPHLIDSALQFIDKIKANTTADEHINIKVHW